MKFKLYELFQFNNILIIKSKKSIKQMATKPIAIIK